MGGSHRAVVAPRHPSTSPPHPLPCFVAVFVARPSDDDIQGLTQHRVGAVPSLAPQCLMKLAPLPNTCPLQTCHSCLPPVRRLIPSSLAVCVCMLSLCITNYLCSWLYVLSLCITTCALSCTCCLCNYLCPPSDTHHYLCPPSDTRHAGHLNTLCPPSDTRHTGHPNTLAAVWSAAYARTTGPIF